MNALFHTVPPDAKTMLVLVALASTVLWVEEARKLLVRRFRKAGA
jgi:Ca2+-transporting ATPase